MSEVLRLSLIGASFRERAVKLRLPFRFGVVTLREAPQVFVRARIKLADGREGEGASAELLVPKWFDKSPDLSNEDNFNQLRRSLAIARDHLVAAGQASAFGLTAAVDAADHAQCAREGLNGLVASFGMALMERAIIDASARLEKVPAVALVRDNRLGISATLTPDLAGFALDKFLGALAPADVIFARHTVGLLDALREVDVKDRLNDGLPESLEAVIAAYGQRYFKLKVGGNLDADTERLAQIASVLDTIPDKYAATLDGNEQYEDAEAVQAARTSEVVSAVPRAADQPRACAGETYP
jgi:hypothetical protein